MPEVKRWYIGVYGGEAQARPCSPAEFEIINEREGRYFVLKEDFDRVTAERDAALGREAKLIVNAERGKRKYQKQLQRLQVAVGQRNTYKGQVIDLQHRLTAADARVELLRKAHPFTNDVAHDVDVWLEIDAALNPVNGDCHHGYASILECPECGAPYQ